MKSMQNSITRIRLDNRPTCFMVIKPSSNYAMVYEELKRYKEVHGYHAHCPEIEGCVDKLSAYLPDSYVDESIHYSKYGSLLGYYMTIHKYIGTLVLCFTQRKY